MRIRLTVALSALALFVAACGAGVGTESEPGVTLRYGYEPGNTLVYDSTADVSGTMVSQGEDVAIESTTTGYITYDFAEGPEPDTLVMSVVNEIIDGRGTAEIGGTEIDLPRSDVVVGPTTLEYVFNARGEVIDYSIESDFIPPGLMEMFGGGSIEGTPAQYIGPPLPDGSVEVGTEWTTEQRAEVLGFDFGSVSRHTIAAVEEMGGRTTHRIETVTTTMAIESDMTPFLAALAEDPDWLFEILGEEASDENREDLAAAFSMMEALGVEILYRMPETVGTQTTWFDAATGTVVRMDIDATTAYAVTMSNIPGEDDIEMSLRMETSSTMTLQG